MSRRWHSANVMLGVLVLITACRVPAACTPAFSQEVSRDAKAALTERDRLQKQTERLGAAGKLAEAIGSAKAMLAIERKVLPSGHDDIVSSLDRLAGLYVKREDFAEATAARQEALEILRKRFGGTHWKATDARLALDNAKLRAALTREQRQRLAESDRLNQEVVALYEGGKYGEAAKSARRALALQKGVLGELHPDYAASLNNLGLLLYSQGEYDAARPLYERALAIKKQVLGECHPAYATSLNNLAELLCSQGDHIAARPLYERALAIRKELLGERHPAYATSLNNLAFLLSAQGDYAAARPLYEQALAIRKAARGERHPDYASSLNNLAALLDSQGDYAAARPLYEQALAIRKEVQGERHPDYAMSLNNLAYLLYSQRDYAAARPLYEQALAIRKEVLGERHPDFVMTLDNLACLFTSQGDYAAARPLYERVLLIRKEVLGERHYGYARSLNNLAFLRALQGEYAAARPLYERSLAIHKEMLGERHPDYAQSLINLGLLVWAQKDVADGASLLNHALGIAEGNLELAALAQSERQQLAMAQHLRGQLDWYLSLSPLAGLSAQDAYRHVLASKGAVFERQRRFRARRRMHGPDPGSEAGRRFGEYAQTVRQLSALALATPDLKKVQEWKTRLEDLSRRKDELEAELTRLDGGFRAQHAAASREPEQLQLTLPNETTALVDLLVYTASQPPSQGKGEFVNERRMVAFVVRPGRPVARIELGAVAPITNAIDAWRPVLISREAAPTINDAAAALRHLIWDPLEAHLAGITSVLVSPDGPIGQVPLGALPGKQPGRYLIEERSIAIVPVPRMFASDMSTGGPGQVAVPTQADSPPAQLLAGDINYGDEPGAGADRGASRSAAISTRAGFLPNFAHLDATRDEILAVRDSFERRFPNARADVLREGGATESAFRREAPGHRYIHLATHGYFAPPELRSALGPKDDSKASRPGIDSLVGSSVAGYHPGLLSGIALAGANIRPTPLGQDDGILTALEVAELDLSGVELAVLSACETGLGEVAGGEGLLGLQRAFQVAGAHSVVASLWKIGDEPTRGLMTRFYENLWRKGQPPAQALREAQLSMLRGDLGRGGLTRKTEKSNADRLPPYYWAAFVLSTDRP
jgi:CHAT domain-containing protein/Tfp pilus assembly protein PilF